MVHLSGAYAVLGMDGIQAGQYDPLRGIVAAALLHGSDDHIQSNTRALIPLLIGFGLIDKRPLLPLLAMIFLAGVFVWWFAHPMDGPYMGASDVVYALVAYLIVQGLRQGEPIPLLIAGAVAIYFGIEMILASTPDGYGIGWKGHLAGMAAGLIVGLARPVR